VIIETYRMEQHGARRDDTDTLLDRYTEQQAPTNAVASGAPSGRGLRPLLAAVAYGRSGSSVLDILSTITEPQQQAPLYLHCL
jgi:hypothetical protein